MLKRYERCIELTFPKLLSELLLFLFTLQNLVESLPNSTALWFRHCWWHLHHIIWEDPWDQLKTFSAKYFCDTLFHWSQRLTLAGISFGTRSSPSTFWFAAHRAAQIGAQDASRAAFPSRSFAVNFRKTDWKHRPNWYCIKPTIQWKGCSGHQNNAAEMKQKVRIVTYHSQRFLLCLWQNASNHPDIYPGWGLRLW